MIVAGTFALSITAPFAYAQVVLTLVAARAYGCLWSCIHATLWAFLPLSV
jgi:hypothetical protein